MTSPTDLPDLVRFVPCEGPATRFTTPDETAVCEFPAAWSVRSTCPEPSHRHIPLCDVCAADLLRETRRMGACGCSAHHVPVSAPTFTFGEI